MESTVYGCNMTDELTNFPTRWKTLLFLGLSGCASGPPTVPYPAFIVVDELPDAFVAGLPGVRAKQLTGDSHTGRSGSRIQIPADWEFSTGASPGLSVEIFVLAGELHLGEFSLTAGGYAYVPPGSTGLPMRSESGATVLYFLDPANERAVIQTLLITNSNLLKWESPIFEFGGNGSLVKELRADPGSGTATWLLELQPGATQTWQYSLQTLEGYLLSGKAVDAECLAGESVAYEYSPGGYFHRPPGAIHGGPEATTESGAVWFLRSPGSDQIEIVQGCSPVPE